MATVIRLSGDFPDEEENEAEDALIRLQCEVMALGQHLDEIETDMWRVLHSLAREHREN